MLVNHMAVFLKERGRRLLRWVCIWANKKQAAKWRKKAVFKKQLPLEKTYQIKSQYHKKAGIFCHHKGSSFLCFLMKMPKEENTFCMQKSLQDYSFHLILCFFNLRETDGWLICNASAIS